MRKPIIAALAAVAISAAMPGIANIAKADVIIPPPPPPPPPGDGGSTAAPQQSGRSAGSGVGQAIVVGQIVAGACTVFVIAAHAGHLGNQERPRELTPIEAYNDGARCGAFPMVIASALARASGWRDNRCTYEVAHQAHLANNTPLAREENLWGRDGSDKAWDNRQRRFMEQYADAYRHCPDKILKKTKKKKKKIIRSRKRTALTS